MDVAIRRAVLETVALFCHADPTGLRGYFRLRQPKGEIPGLRLDSISIQQVGELLNAKILLPYHQPIRPDESDDANNVVTISDLADLVEAKVEAAKGQRVERLRQEAVAGIRDIARQPEWQPQEADSLRNAPLNLNVEQMDRLRQVLNEKLAHYGNPQGVTPEELSPVLTVGQLFRQLETEVQNSPVFP
jgi:hypothetical protein